MLEIHSVVCLITRHMCTAIKRYSEQLALTQQSKEPLDNKKQGLFSDGQKKKKASNSLKCELLNIRLMDNAAMQVSMQSEHVEQENRKIKEGIEQ